MVTASVDGWTTFLAAAVSLVVYVGVAAADVRGKRAAAVDNQVAGVAPVGAVDLAAGPVVVAAADAGVAVPAKT